MKLKTDLSIDLDIKSTHKFIKSMIKISSKLYESRNDNKAIHDLIYENRYCKIIDKKL